MASINTSELRPILWPGEWDKPELLNLAAKSGLNCVVLSREAAKVEPAARGAGLEVLPAGEKGFNAPEGVTLVEDGVWPKVARSKGDPDSVEAGPTGLPWIDSNGWKIQLAAARNPGKTCWVQFDAPAGEVLRASAYEIAIADCEAHGGRWVVSPDSGLSKGVAAGNGTALEIWKALVQTVAYYRDQQAGDFGCAALLGVVSDFAGDNEYLGHEFLNLIAREYVPVRILLKTGAAPRLEGLRMVVYLDAQPLPGVWKQALSAFVSSGGMLLTGRSADPGFGAPASSISGLEYKLRSAGKGRIAVATGAFDDPWRVAADAHVLLGRSNDVLRQANAGSMSVLMAAAANARRARLQLVNYAGRPGLNPVTLTLLHRYRTARFRTRANPAPAEVPVAQEYGRTAVYLPQFSTCGTLDVQA
jgi:hypothetical protein